MDETFLELAKRDREQAIQRLMEAWKIGRIQAERIVAVHLGEFEGDIVTVDESGNEVPLTFDGDDWLQQIT